MKSDLAVATSSLPLSKGLYLCTFWLKTAENHAPSRQLDDLGGIFMVANIVENSKVPRTSALSVVLNDEY